MDLSFKGRAKRIDDVDLPKLGALLKVGEDELHAFIDAETSGSGFDAAGRPKMLFEPHVFYRNLTGGKRAEAVKQGLAYAKWGLKPYPRDSYSRLRAAIAIDETAALKSASWGLGQVLGENYKLAGFETVQAMVKAMMDDEEAHLDASVNFIKNAGLDDELRAHNWKAFAEGYNGPGYKKNGYDKKLADAFAKWSRIRDTPWKPGEPEPVKVDPPKPSIPRPDEDPGPVARQPDDPGVDPGVDPGDKPEPKGKGWVQLLAAAVVVGAWAAWEWLVSLPCNLLGVFCG